MRLPISFFPDEHAQDLIEYSLLIGFLALVVTVIMMHVSGGINGVWTQGNRTLASAIQQPSVQPVNPDHRHDDH